MTKDYSLELYGPVKQGQNPLMGLTNLVKNWKRSTTFTGGPWQGSFKIFGDRDFLEQWFYQNLGYHVVETSYGVTTWEGLVWELDFVDFDVLQWTRFSRRGRRRRRTYESLANRVLVAYNDPETGANGESAWFDETVSQGLYGIKEEVLYRDVQDAIADEVAAEHLEMHAYPDPQLISFEENVDEPYLEVNVVGYVATAQFQYTETIDDTTVDVATWVADIFDTDLEFLSKSRVAANARVIDQSLGERMRAWDLLENLLTLRDGSGNHFNITIEPGRVISYDQWSPTPIGYFWNSALVSPHYNNLEERPRLVRPGIYRDSGFLSGYSTRQVSGSFFEEPGDFLLETVEVDEEGRLIPRLGIYEEEESLRTFSFG